MKMNEVECIMCGGRSVYFCWWILRTYVDQEHSSDQADTFQPAAQTQPSAASLVSHFISFKPNT